MSTLLGLGLLAAKAGKLAVGLYQAGSFLAFAGITAAAHPFAHSAAPRDGRRTALGQLDAMSDAELQDIGLKRGDLGAVLDCEHPAGELNHILDERYGRRH